MAKWLSQGQLTKKFSSQGPVLRASLQFKDHLTSGPTHLFYITLWGWYLNRTHFGKGRYLNRIRPEKMVPVVFWIGFLFPEDKWANGVGRVSLSSSMSLFLWHYLSVSLCHSLSPSLVHFFKKNIYIKLNFPMWLLIFRKLITSLHVTVSLSFVSSHISIPYLISSGGA